MDRAERSAVARVLSLVSAASMAFAAAGPAHAWGRSAALTTQEGITLIDEVRETNTMHPTYLWTRLGDAQGRTVLVSDQDPAGVSQCTAECAREFPPLLARGPAKRAGDWSVIHRADGQLQWAYQSQPLYTWSKETVPGRVATTVALTESADDSPVNFSGLAAQEKQLPPPGWHVARFEPAKHRALPDAIEVHGVPAASAVALTDARGLTLYAFDGDAKKDGQSCSIKGCALQWLPVAAAALASNVGEFSVVTRLDGSKQWAYQGHPLYTFVGDSSAGEARGMNLHTRWHVAVIEHHFNPPAVSIRPIPGYGSVLSAQGRTLYAAAGFERRIVGSDSRTAFPKAYYKGKKLGERGCITTACLRTWHPFLAPSNARSNGYWEVLLRSDGTRQWAYKGYALYTYVGDETPTDINGNDTYEYAISGQGTDPQRVKFLTQFNTTYTGAPGAGAGVYWHIMQP